MPTITQGQDLVYVSGSYYSSLHYFVCIKVSLSSVLTDEERGLLTSSLLANRNIPESFDLHVYQKIDTLCQLARKYHAKGIPQLCLSTLKGKNYIHVGFEFSQRCLLDGFMKDTKYEYSPLLR